MQVSCHACPAHVHSARTQPVCIEHLMVRWLILLHGCGEAAGGSATSCLQHVPVSMLPQRCQSACILLTTCAPPAITGDDASERPNIFPRGFDKAACMWQLLATSASPCWSALVLLCARRLFVEVNCSFYRACNGPIPQRLAHS